MTMSISLLSIGKKPFWAQLVPQALSSEGLLLPTPVTSVFKSHRTLQTPCLCSNCPSPKMAQRPLWRPVPSSKSSKSTKLQSQLTAVPLGTDHCPMTLPRDTQMQPGSRDQGALILAFPMEPSSMPSTWQALNKCHEQLSPEEVFKKVRTKERRTNEVTGSAL